MLEFVCGFLSGVIGFVMFKKRLVNRSIGVQAEEVRVPSQPILIQNSKTKFIPELRNFWGPDS
jgi:hypothetical protein